MQSGRVVLGVAVVLIILAGLLAACGGTTPDPVQPTEAPGEEPTEVPAEEPASIDAEMLLEERCTECHGLDRVEQAEKTRDQWEQTVIRMVNKGAELSEDEQTVLIDYLEATYGP